jgi:ubiquinone/menaquinone biosynthesis C-methylase UbiE
MKTAIQKGYKGVGMEGTIARQYEKNTRKDMAEFRKIAERLKADFPDGGSLLEIAPGPGFLSVEMAKDGKFRVTGMDISKTFVELGHKNASEAGVEVEFRQGNASAMPFADSSFDLLVCRSAFKNFSEPVKALKEMHRVLRPGGVGVINDLRRDATMGDISKHANELGGSALNRWFIRQTFRFVLLKRAYTKHDWNQMLKQVPFREVEIQEEAIEFEVRFSK